VSKATSESSVSRASLTEGEIDQVVARYVEAMARYEDAAIAVEARLRRELRAAGKIRALLSSRAKHPDEVRNKILKKRDAGQDVSFDSLSNNMNVVLTDLAGVRVVVYDPRDEERVFELVQRKLDVCALPNAVERKHDADKNYRASHVLVAVDDSFGRDTIRGTIVEVQIVSIANHVFNELEHDIGYKAHGVAPTSAVSSALLDVLHAGRLLNSLVPRLLDERAASMSDAGTKLADVEVLRFTLEKLVGRPLSGDFARLFRLLNASQPMLTPAVVRDLGGGPAAALEVGRARAEEMRLPCTEDVTAYVIGLYPELGGEFASLARSWPGPVTELRRAILDLEGKEPQ
jgi:ppGpp synthetase/RelA/SpoT-type nucleotidyltranferase